MSRSSNDVIAVLRGMQLVTSAICHEQNELCRVLWSNSSIRELLEVNLEQGTKYCKRVGNSTEELKKFQDLLRETGERSFVVVEGLRQLAGAKVPQEFKMSRNSFQKVENDGVSKGSKGHTQQFQTDAANLDISSITLKEFEEILSKRNKHRDVSLRTAATDGKQLKDDSAIEEIPNAKVSTTQPKTTETLQADTEFVEDVLKMVVGTSNSFTNNSSVEHNKANVIELPVLSKMAKQRSVPSSRFGRLVSFGGLFAGLGVGTINELTKGALGLGGSKNIKEAFLSPANAERIVDTLCKVRGAALKIGQILSIQDSSVVSPQLATAFERVRQAADYMPDWQVERVMVSQIGPDWREMLELFEEKPFAAASIGQVHRAKLKNGMQVAIKIQYPGVAQSIESDIDNLIGMMKVWDIFPHGFFIDNVVKVAKRELNWEVDYIREAEYTEKFKEMIAPYADYYVPAVIKEMTTSSVLTTELVPGVPLDKCFEMSYDHRKHIAESILKLCLRELFELQCMQTDPNWSNFLYDFDTKRLMLIDFGSTRFYPKHFIKNYRNVIICAANNNRQGVLQISREMGFLTGYETKQMEEAHIDAVMILGEIFRFDGDFDFGRQNTTERIAHLVPTMVSHRLCPPPEEIYSIHRKLSGIFLLCARLNIKMNCRPFYKEIIIDKFRE